MLNASPCIGPLPRAFAQPVRVQATGRQPVLFEDLAPEAKAAALQYVFDDEAPVEWSEEDVVELTRFRGHIILESKGVHDATKCTAVLTRIPAADDRAGPGRA